MAKENLPRTIWWEVDETTGKSGVYLIDQTRLPLQGDVLCCNTHEGVCIAISSMAVRGASALGLAAAFALAVWSENESSETEVAPYLAALDAIAKKVLTLRPTTANLSWGAMQVFDCAKALAKKGESLDVIKKSVLDCALSLCEEDERCCLKIGEIGAALFDNFEIHENEAGEPEGGARILTISNAGSLASARYGTVTSIISSLHEQGRLAQAWVCETRPRNQGARLTIWEFMICGIPSALICDSTAASVIAKGWVDAIIVGADCICANGDVVSKIGTYNLACLAKMHNIPFYVAATSSTIDLSRLSGDEVKIEQRDPREVEGFSCSGIILPGDQATSQSFDKLTALGDKELLSKQGHQIAISRKGGAYAFDAWMRATPEGVLVYNPAFDVTPADLVSAVITQDGIRYGRMDVCE